MNNLMVAQELNITNKKLYTATQNIIKAGEKLGNAQMDICYQLAKIEKEQLIVDDGFKNTADYLIKVFNMSKTTAYDLIAISELIDTDTKKCVLPIEKTDWSHTQLHALLPVRKEFKNSFVSVSLDMVKDGIINSDMSVRELSTAVDEYLHPVDEPEETEETEEVIDADATETDTALYTFTFTEWENKGIVLDVNGEQLPADFTREQLTELFNSLLAKFSAR